jgi:hypothetical protein
MAIWFAKLLELLLLGISFYKLAEHKIYQVKFANSWSCSYIRARTLGVALIYACGCGCHRRLPLGGRVKKERKSPFLTNQLLS